MEIFDDNLMYFEICWRQELLLITGRKRKSYICTEKLETGILLGNDVSSLRFGSFTSRKQFIVPAGYKIIWGLMPMWKW